MTLMTDRERWEEEALRYRHERDDPEAALASLNARLFADIEASVGDREALRRAQRRADLRLTELSLVDGGGPEHALDVALEMVLRNNPSSIFDAPEARVPYTGSLDAARSFVAEALPGFWVSSGLCDLTGHASLGPDYNGPHRERLFREWPADECPCEWSEDLTPGGAIGRECRAILAAAVRALAHRDDLLERQRSKSA